MSSLSAVDGTAFAIGSCRDGDGDGDGDGDDDGDSDGDGEGCHGDDYNLTLGWM